MDIKDVKLRKGMNRDEVNELISKWLTLEDDIYLGNRYKHNWRCKCGNVFIRQWVVITDKTTTQRCNSCSKSIKINNIVKTKYSNINVNINNLNDVHLHKGMSKNDINKIIGKWIKLNDEIYLGNSYKHSWICSCGNIFKRKWGNIRNQDQIDCGCKEYAQQEQYYKYEVEKDGDYEYIRSYRSGDILPNGRAFKKHSYLQVKHKYCGSVYEVTANNFINNGHRCIKCCQEYENSFAYHIEVELGESLEKYWDFEKNTVNPYHISRRSGQRVLIKCTKTDHHGSYESRCADFTNGNRCPYCNTFASKKVHLFDSFGYNHFDKVQSWHPDNKISPFRVALNSNKKYKFICPECGCEWGTALSHISRGTWCPVCNSSKGEKKINSWLRLNNINFIPQKEFEGLIGLGGKNLSYDFYLPDYNLLIEYQGKQHERFVKGFHENKECFKKQQEHDKRKKEYAKKNNIELIEIWYWDFDNIDEILKNELNI